MRSIKTDSVFSVYAMLPALVDMIKRTLFQGDIEPSSYPRPLQNSAQLEVFGP